MREPHIIFTFDATDDNPVGDLFPSYEECEGCPLCDPAEGFTNPDDCPHCELYQHYCAKACTEAGCPCHA